MKRKLFSVKRFAELSRTTKDTLYHYDRIGVLPPVVRGENSYRYYSHTQFATVNLIRILQELGMSLDEIMNLKDKRTPEFLDNLYFEQIGKIEKKIDSWVGARKFLVTYREIIRSVLNEDEFKFTIQTVPATAIIMGGPNDYSGDRDDYDALLDFYNEMHSKYPNLNLNYPVWALYSAKRIKSGDHKWPDRYYFYNPEGFEKRPAATYAIGYTRGGYGQTGDLYERMLAYIEKEGYEITGDAYEEYPINELSVGEESNYLIRIMITVSKK